MEIINIYYNTFKYGLNTFVNIVFFKIRFKINKFEKIVFLFKIIIPTNIYYVSHIPT